MAKLSDRIKFYNSSIVGEKRAIRIVELEEELDRAKAYIAMLVWPSDGSVFEQNSIVQDAAKFAGCDVPKFDERHICETGG